MLKKALLLFFIIASLTPLYSESQFSLDLEKDSILGAASLGVFVTAQFFDSGAEDSKSKSDINGFDRTFVYGYSESLDTTGTVLSVANLLLPGALMLNENGRDNWLSYGVMYTEAFLLTAGTKDLLKNLISRNRPYTYADDSIPSSEKDDYYNSFPSGHTSYAFLGATFLTTVLVNDYPDSPWKTPLIAGSYALAGGVGALRIASGCHFISDVLAGAAIGSFFGWFVPAMHINHGENEIAMIPSGRGITCALNY